MASNNVPLAMVVALLAIGCSNPEPADEGKDDDAIAEDATDTTSLESDTELLTSSLVAAAPGGTIGLASLGNGDLEQATIGDGVRAIYLPRTCVSVVDDPASHKATYKFDNCVGPNGLRGVRGEVAATYTTTPNHLHLELVATNLTVNRATLDWSATADIDVSGVDRTMTWHAQLSGTTARGRNFARSNQKTIRWKAAEACFSLEGVSQGDVHGRTLKTEIVNFRRCRGSCPDADGKIVVTNLNNGFQIEIAFDGTDKAKVTGPGVRSELPLLCR